MQQQFGCVRLLKRTLFCLLITLLQMASSTVSFPRHLLDLSSYSSGAIQQILTRSITYKQALDRSQPIDQTLKERTVATLFFEPSTRTKLSFQQAIQYLGGRHLGFSAKGSSVSKGESLKDTAQTLQALHADMFVVRHAAPGAAQYLTTCTDAVVINAGDGAHAHPTQALLDLCTLATVYPDIAALHVAIIGDILHSRVARSVIRGLRTLGASVTVCGPPPLVPAALVSMGVRVTHALDEALQQCDVAMALRIQQERQGGGAVSSLGAYHAQFGITMEHMKRYPDLRIMHPGPVNRGVELAAAVADHERTLIRDQVANGIPTRMAVLDVLAHNRTSRQRWA